MTETQKEDLNYGQNEKVYYLVYVIGVIIFAGAIWLLVEKRRAKKMAKAEPDTKTLR